MSDPYICSWRGGPILTARARKLIQNPKRIVAPYLSAGMTAMDIGSGMGFFTVPISDIVGKKGKVIAVDLQKEMLAGLKDRASKAGCENILYQQCDYNSLNIQQWKGSVDFVLIFMMLHEVPDADRLIREVNEALAPGGKLLFSEPVVHVDSKKFQSSRKEIERSGFTLISSPRIALCRSAIFQKNIN
jgi:ubiquinone/menaquinone biosynthesis C-methylase UbiE